MFASIVALFYSAAPQCFTNYSLTPSLTHIHYIIYRPVFRFSHHTGGASGVNSSYPLTACSCGDGCRLCLASVRMVHPVPLTLDGFRHSHNFNSGRRGSLDSCCRLGVALPPLRTQGDEGDSYAELHALGHSVTKYPPRAADRRNG